VNLSQSEKVKHRARKLKYKLKDDYKVGQCSLCQRNGIKIINEKHGLCLRCHRWCKKFLYKKFGYLRWSHFIEAVQFFLEPVKCQFYEYCGNTTTRLKDNGEIRGENKPYVCDKCRPMWDAGFKSGKRHIKDTVRKGRKINVDFNK